MKRAAKTGTKRYMSGEALGELAQSLKLLAVAEKHPETLLDSV
jgi:hypothetical protein